MTLQTKNQNKLIAITNIILVAFIIAVIEISEKPSINNLEIAIKDWIIIGFEKLNLISK